MMGALMVFLAVLTAGVLLFAFAVHMDNEGRWP